MNFRKFLICKNMKKNLNIESIMRIRKEEYLRIHITKLKNKFFNFIIMRLQLKALKITRAIILRSISIKIQKFHGKINEISIFFLYLNSNF